MGTKMEELKMCHITLGKGQRGEKSLLQTSLFPTWSSISENLVYHAGLFALTITVLRIGTTITS